MHGVEFHYFCDDQNHPPCQGALTAADFSELVAYLRRNYTLLNAQDFYDAVASGEGKPGQICLTFDDGVRSQWDVAVPCMEKMGLTGMFFVYTSHFENDPSMLEVYHDFRFRKYAVVDDFYTDFFSVLKLDPETGRPDVLRKMADFRYESYLAHCPWHSYTDKLFRYTRDQLLTQTQYRRLMRILMEQKEYSWQEACRQLWISGQELKQLETGGHMVGLHSHTHPTNICALNEQAHAQEYIRNARCLEQILGHKIHIAAYPCGGHSDYARAVLAQLGVRLAFTAEMTQRTDPMLMPRKNHPLVVKEMKR